jgi:hypothetical protein
VEEELAVPAPKHDLESRSLLLDPTADSQEPELVWVDIVVVPPVTVL